MIKRFAATVALGFALIGTPALAIPTLTGVPCAGVVVGQTACSGFYAGNLLNNSPADVANQIFGLQAVGFDTTGFNFNSYLKIANNGGSTTVDFPGLFVGDTIIGIHFGGGAFPGGGNDQATGFFKINAGAGLDTLTLNLSSSSGVVLYQTGGAVPEPATWGMMIVGFGGIGALLRTRRRQAALPA